MRQVEKRKKDRGRDERMNEEDKKTFMTTEYILNKKELRVRTADLVAPKAQIGRAHV